MVDDVQIPNLFREQVDLYKKALTEHALMDRIGARGGEVDEITLFLIIRSELYKFFCSTDDYESTRKDVSKDYDRVLMFICGGVATSVATSGLSIPVALLTASTALMLRVTLSVGVKSLCRYVDKFSLDDVEG